MSLNITVASPYLLLCATDRRLTTFGNGAILTERSTKLLSLQCADAVALITYNGVGEYKGETPVDWLLDLNARASLTQMRYHEVLEAIRDDTECRIRALPSHIPSRHTFVSVAGRSDSYSVHVISNHEAVGGDKPTFNPQNRFSLSSWEPRPGFEIMVLATGAIGSFRHGDGKSIAKSVKAVALPLQVKNRCAKAIKGAAFRQNRHGTVGTSVSWSFMQPGRPMEGGLDVIGGTSVIEMPAMIRPHGMVKDIYVETPAPGAEFTSRFDARIGEFSLPEKPCRAPGCPGRLPPGYSQCPVCGNSKEES